MDLMVDSTNHASVVQSFGQSPEVIRSAKGTVKLVQILLPVAVPWLAVGCPGLYLERYRGDPDLFKP